MLHRLLFTLKVQKRSTYIVFYEDVLQETLKIKSNPTHFYLNKRNRKTGKIDLLVMFSETLHSVPSFNIGHTICKNFETNY